LPELRKARQVSVRDYDAPEGSDAGIAVKRRKACEGAAETLKSGQDVWLRRGATLTDVTLIAGLANLPFDRVRIEQIDIGGSDGLKVALRYSDGVHPYRPGYDVFEPEGEDEPLSAEEALAGINLIRNSIVGAQAINWSEHIYPLVALLNRAGMQGLPYPEAKKNIGMLIDFRDEATALLKDAQEAVMDRGHVDVPAPDDNIVQRIDEFLERTGAADERAD
jgi:hypothetical protein